MCYIEDLQNLSRVASRIPWTVSDKTPTRVKPMDSNPKRPCGSIDWEAETN